MDFQRNGVGLVVALCQQYLLRPTTYGMTPSAVCVCGVYSEREIGSKNNINFWCGDCDRERSLYKRRVGGSVCVCVCLSEGMWVWGMEKTEREREREGGGYKNKQGTRRH